MVEHGNGDFNVAMSPVSPTRIQPLEERARLDQGKQLHYPPPLKPPQPPPLKRYQSAPVKNQKSPGQRRSIFGKELASSAHYHGTTPPPSPLSRRRPVSLSERNLSPRDAGDTNFFASLSRPKSETRLEERPHFRDLGELSEDVLDQLELPTLPTPLMRFHDGTRCQYLGGMYPLTQPDPILRHKEISFEEASQQSGDSCQANEDDYISEPPPIPPPAALNLTKSVRYFGSGTSARKASSTTCDDTSTSSSHSDSNPGRKVRFDPRVTITEFEDDPEYRQWFSDFELERFKNETVTLAQQYLMKHPSVLEDYCKPYLDPVTGTLRKKALFSMLVLKATRSDDSLDEIQSETSETRYEKMRQELANQNFQRILLVNHNELALNLFERSLMKIFPAAQFSRCCHNDEALQMIQKRGQSDFDLVLTEDHTQRPWKSCEGLDKGADNSEAKQSQEQVYSSVSKASSADSPLRKQSGSLSAAELVRFIRGMERLDETKPAMLIAVSTNPEASRKHLQASGADAVWGLPPPHMSSQLRDELVARVIQKRRRETSQGSSIPFRLPCHPQG